MNYIKYKREFQKIEKRVNSLFEEVKQKEKEILDLEKDGGFSNIKRKEYILLCKELIEYYE